MYKWPVMLLCAVLLGGCQTTGPTKPKNQTHSLGMIRGKLGDLRPGMPEAHVRKVLGAPSLIDDRGTLIKLWYYLPDRAHGLVLQYPDKLRVVFTDGFYSRYSYETTYAEDYNWKF